MPAAFPRSALFAEWRMHAAVLLFAVCLCPDAALAKPEGADVRLPVQGFSNGARAQAQFVDKKIRDRDTGGAVIAREVTLTIKLHVDVLEPSTISVRHPDYPRNKDHTREVAAGKSVLGFVFTGRFPLMDQYKHVWRPGKTNKIKPVVVAVLKKSEPEEEQEDAPSKDAPSAPLKMEPAAPKFTRMPVAKAFRLWQRLMNSVRRGELSQRERDALDQKGLRVESKVACVVDRTELAADGAIEVYVDFTLRDRKTGQECGLRYGGGGVLVAVKGDEPAWPLDRRRRVLQIPWSVAYDLKKGHRLPLTWYYYYEDGQLKDGIRYP